MLKTRSVWSEPTRDDGLRILATRFRGRGLPATRYDVWMPSLGPSEQLLKAVLAGTIDWKTFAKRYREELFMDGPIDDRSDDDQEPRPEVDAAIAESARRETARHADVPLR